MEQAQKVLDFIAQTFPKDFKKIRFGTQPAAEEFWQAVGATGFPSDVNVGVGINLTVMDNRLVIAENPPGSSPAIRNERARSGYQPAPSIAYSTPAPQRPARSPG